MNTSTVNWPVSQVVEGQKSASEFQSRERQISRIFSEGAFSGILGLNTVRKWCVRQWILPAIKNTSDQVLPDKDKRLAGLKRKYIDITTFDGVKLDGLMIAHPRKPLADQKWIVYFNGNSSRLESKYDELIAIAKVTKANVLTFNYRGVGKSKGFPLMAEDLVLDGEAALKHLLDAGIPKENILIHGWSLGGGVGAQVAAKYPGVRFCSDRSFASFSGAAEGMVNYFVKESPGIQMIPYIHILAFAVRKLMHPLVYIFGWELNSVKAWNEIQAQKWAMYHKKDTVIDYKIAGLHPKLPDHFKGEGSIELKVSEISAHCDHINQFQTQFPIYGEKVRAALAIEQSTQDA